MFTTYKCFGEDDYNKLVRFEDLEIGDIFVINYNFAQPIIKTLKSMDAHFNFSNAINLINRNPIAIPDNKIVTVFKGQVNLPVSEYLLSRDTTKG